MTKVFAHRGFSGKYPENTMPAFEAAMDLGVDGIEFDVQFSKDGQLVIIHDETVDRTTTGKGLVREYTLEELQQFEASAGFRGQYGFVTIPTLETYLQRVKSTDLITNIELKTGRYEYPGIEAAVLELLRKYDLVDRVIISSFNHFSVLRMQALCPEIKCAFLSDNWMIDAGKYTASFGVQCYHPHFTNLIPDVVSELKSHALEINTWTVNTAEDALRMQALGIDSVIGNYPDMLKEVLS